MSFAAKTIKTGWRAFSTQFQTDFNQATSVNTSLNFEGVPSSVDVNNDWMNTDEITGRLGPTIHQIISLIMNGGHAQKVASHQVGLIAGMAMGNIVTSGLTPKIHTITPKTSNMLLPCRTMIEDDGFERRQFLGVVCSEYTIDGKRDDFCKLDAKLMGTGASSSVVTSRPTQLIENYLLYANSSFSKNGSSMNSELQDFKFTYKNNAVPIYEFNDASRFVTRFERGNIEASLECTIELVSASHYNELINGTDLAITIALNGGTRNKVDINLPKCRCRKHTKDVDGEKLIAKLEFAVLDDLTDWVEIVVTNNQTAYQ